MSVGYEEFFSLREHPFSITPDPRFVYLSDGHREALEHLDYGAAGDGNGFVLLTGDVGAGKTMLCRAFLERLPPKTEVVLILNPVLTLNEFLQTICDELDLIIEGSRESNKNLIDHFNRFLLQVYAVGHKTILIVDEAQNLSHELLEQIRLLTNLESKTDKLLQIFLIGQPDLRALLQRPDLLQVAQRITSRYHLGPLNKQQTREYIQKRLSVAGGKDIEFTSSAIRRIYDYSKGLPRLINILCDKAMLCAYKRSSHKIDATTVRDGERLLLGARKPTTHRFLKIAAVSLSVAIVLVAVTVFGPGYLFNAPDLRSWVGAKTAGLEPATQDDSLKTPLADIRSSMDPIPSTDSQTAAIRQSEGVTGKRPSVGTKEGQVQAKHPSVDAKVAANLPASQDEPTMMPLEDKQSPVDPKPTMDLRPAAVRQPEAVHGEASSVETKDRPAQAKMASVADAKLKAGDLGSLVPREDDTTLAATSATMDPSSSATADVRGKAHAEAPPIPRAPAAVDELKVRAPRPAPATSQSRLQDELVKGRLNRTVPRSLAGYTRNHAERKLLAIWGVNDAQAAGENFCQAVLRHDLQCLSEASGLDGLQRYNRPAILALDIADKFAYAVMVKVSPNQVVLNVLNREHVLPAKALRDVWDGRFLLLWRPSSATSGNVALGARGPGAAWVRRAIDQVEGTSTTGDLYDEQMVTRVKRFQRAEGLAPDGIVGPRTLIVLQNKLGIRGS